MSAGARPTVVLKFGGSVLDGDDGYRAAIAEIVAEVDAGRQVVAVVSARRGATDALLSEAGRVSADPDDEALAGLLATGEEASAFLLAIAARQAGIPSRALSRTELGLRAQGPRLEAEPRSIDGRRLQRLLQRHGLLVVPGFVAVHVHGGPAVLGRGGSDLTALFLAERLAASACRLIKDAGGLFPSDPKLLNDSAHESMPHASWSEVATLGGRVVQGRALQFAAEHGIAFRIAGIGCPGTLVGPPEQAADRVAVAS